MLIRVTLPSRYLDLGTEYSRSYLHHWFERGNLRCREERAKYLPEQVAPWVIGRYLMITVGR